METKPYSIQSPEQIAKDYGGNKQKIAEAMQMGILDPTAGTLAGMFIDRMRSAAQTEAAPQQPVAQQVFAPPAPVAPGAGLAATPPAAAMQAPQPPALGMASGGMVPPYASGGLSDVPIPDTMFDEPSNGGFNDGYATGGLVAFAAGDAVVSPSGDQMILTGNAKKRDKDPEYNFFPGTMDFYAPNELGGYTGDVYGNLDTLNEAAPRKVQRAEEYMQMLERSLSPEERAKQKKEDMWLALGQIGARMASTPGSLLQAASAGMAEALPGIASAAKERRGVERELRRELLAEERTGNKEVEARAGVALDMLKNYNSLAEALKNNNFKNLWASLDRATQERIAAWQAAASKFNAITAANASMFGSRLGYLAEGMRGDANINQALQTLLTLSPEFKSVFDTAVKEGTGPEFIQKWRSGFGGGSMGGTPNLPKGFITDKP